MGSINRALIIQEKLSGVQYIVNMVSCEGEHFVSDIWKEHESRTRAMAILVIRSTFLTLRA